MDPCQYTPSVVQLVIAFLAALNTALATVLLDKRLKADIREKRNGTTGKRQSGSLRQSDIDNGGDSDGPREL